MMKLTLMPKLRIRFDSRHPLLRYSGRHRDRRAIE